MARKRLPAQTETTVLVTSRRRCALCFGLNRDSSIKSGQIAHVDRDASNNAIDNLVFLCFEHHDEYDSRPSQRKGISAHELKTYREELIRSLGNAFSQPVHFGTVTLPREDPYAGTYIRIGRDDESAEVIITPLPAAVEAPIRYYVTGTALWGADRPYGPNLGTLDFLGIMDRSGVIFHEEELFGERATTRLEWAPNGTLYISEENWLGRYGMNVNFIGTYKRAS